jgi:non-ribosomal peptide synthetase-like protein
VTDASRRAGAPFTARSRAVGTIRPVHQRVDVPATFLRSGRAASPRTLVDVLETTAAAHGGEPAIACGDVVLTYEQLLETAGAVADELAALGVGRGARVGVRVPSGSTDLHVAILGVLVAGAAYVPIDVDDPPERAATVLREAEADAVVTEGLAVRRLRESVRGDGVPASPDLEDDAWIIFTSGSTGTPKGVAVTHRSAAAFVDAEAALFCQDAPLGPGDRVMAGLSVAFDASCEEMWLAWRHGACLVPAPRSLVRSGADLAPWLVANDVTVVSTVPTLVLMWPPSALDAVRLLILGGEACPPEIGERFATDRREVWNTYGPTEATVVACGARLRPGEPVRIGLPLEGWDLAVVDEQERPVPPGETGQLVIGGVGLARYLDAEKDAATYAPMPSLGWDRAYRSGDRVVLDEDGLLFAGRADDQVKIGGRRIELGEVDNALLALPGVEAAAAAVKRSEAGNSVLVGYVVVGAGFDARGARTLLRGRLPAAAVPRLAEVDALPVRTSGKVDREALPWPLETAGPARLDGTAGLVADAWARILGTGVAGPDDDFFEAGGSSLTAAQLVARLRDTHPEVTVADVYEAPTVGALAARLDAIGTPAAVQAREVRPVPRRAALVQLAMLVPLRALGGLVWVAWTLVGVQVLATLTGWAWWPRPGWSAALVAAVLLLPPVRAVVAAGLVRLLVRPLAPGTHPRAGRVHLRLWAAERVVDELRVGSLAGVGVLVTFARLLGAKVGRDVDLHTLPSVTGLLTLGRGSTVEPETDLSGWWVDGDRLVVGPVRVRAEARVGVRSTLGPGVVVGRRAEVGAGSTVLADVADDLYASGAPAAGVGPARGPAERAAAPRRRGWPAAYALTGAALSALPGLAVGLALAAVVAPAVAVVGAPGTWRAAIVLLLAVLPLVVVLSLALLALLVWAVVRLASRGVEAGVHPVHGRAAWSAWTVLRVLDATREWLFPLYSSSLTPAWLRALGAEVGRDVEASTVLMLPSLTSVGDGAFLADDTMLGMYELGGGWLRVERVKVGRRAFVGNSGMAAPGRKVPARGLVAVLSAAPRRAKATKGSSWLGSPPTRLRRAAGEVDEGRTYEPDRRLRVARALLEACRLLAVLAHGVLLLGTVAVLVALAGATHWWVAALAAGPVLLAAGVVAAAVATAAKWLLVGRVTAGEHPLWSGFVWRNELADAFTEVVAAPWFCRWALGTAALPCWLRTLGARVGRGVWCETYWWPEPDLVVVGDGATVNRGCVVQTHLFHDRILSMDEVRLDAGATLGPHGVVLPAARIGRHARVGPGSLVMRGERVPEGTSWVGNPIGPWTDATAPA